MKQTISEFLLFLRDPAAVLTFYMAGASSFLQLTFLSLNSNFLKFLFTNLRS